MITGIVNAFHEAIIRLPVQTNGASAQEIEVVLDTGFSGSLTLPPNLISALGLPFRSRGSAILADGSQAHFDIHVATVVWNGLPRNILVEAADTNPLVGMSLLYGHDIRIQAVDGGRVTIERLQ